MSQILMIKLVKEHIRFHYILKWNTAAYFYSFVIQHVPLEGLNKVKLKNYS